jgi:cytochrome c-type biogenesis protein
MFDVALPIAFSAGLISFFAPCILPIMPVYISYITGVSFTELKEKGYASYRKKLMLSSVFYVIGFTLIFVALGTTAASIGIFFRQYSDIIQKIGGTIMIVLGLEFAGVIKISSLSREKKLTLPSWANNLGYLRSFILGLIFATAWTPCIGVVLGSILALAAVSDSAVRGAFLLFIYSLGIAFPFLIVSFTLAAAPKYIKALNKYVHILTKIAGFILFIIGVLLLTDTYKYLNAFLFSTAFNFGYVIK